ncbi:MAG: hypothetical protein WCQ57_14205, partial [Verrucomicrobiota bacterium]
DFTEANCRCGVRHCAATTAELAEHCRTPHRQFASVKSALEASRGKTLITGSLFLVGEAMRELGIAV